MKLYMVYKVYKVYMKFLFVGKKFDVVKFLQIKVSSNQKTNCLKKNKKEFV